MKLSKLIIAILFCTSVYAQPPRMDNGNMGPNTPNQNNYAPNQPPTPPQPQANYNSNGLPPGTYNVQNGNGSSSTIYTTGDKQPYIVSPPTTGMESPVIQPYVNYGPNGPTTSGTTNPMNNPGMRGR